MNEHELTAQAAKVGHKDPASLKQLLIATTSTATREIAKAYFQSHLNDDGLLEALVPIALEGEDAGDAPWAAANVITEFPASLLKKHEAALIQLGTENWVYLSRPAKKALDKIAQAGL